MAKWDLLVRVKRQMTEARQRLKGGHTLNTETTCQNCEMLKEAKKLHDHWAEFRAIAERVGIRVAKYPY